MRAPRTNFELILASNWLTHDRRIGRPLRVSQLLAELLERQAHPPLYGAKWETESLRDLNVREASEVGKLDYPSLLRREIIEETAYLPSLVTHVLIRNGLRFRAVSRPVRDDRAVTEF